MNGLATLLLVPILLGHPPDGEPKRPPFSLISVTGGVAHRLPTDLDPGRYSVTRYVVETRVPLTGGRDHILAVSATWMHNRYDFSGSSGFARMEPWERVNMVGGGAFYRKSLGEGWRLLAIPIIRFSAEEGAHLRDALQWGGIGGASVRVDDDLDIGPGIGVITQIEERPSVFPVIFVNWRIARDVRIRTGSGVAASRGPGLSAEWAFSGSGTLTLGGRYEKRRFRLENDGVGEEDALGVVVSLDQKVADRLSLTVFAGIDLAGSIQVDDRSGRRIETEHYRPAPLGGLMVQFRF